MDVNLGPQKSERIIVREYDTAEALAAEFCDKHKLHDPVLRDQLYKLLLIQMDGLLEKIDERAEDEFAN